MHALAIAIARQKKLKDPKGGDPIPMLTKHMQLNLDRIQGKLMERK
jgi:hypothetical protein